MKTANLVYDPMGRLFQVTGPATNTRFLYDGDELALEYDANGAIAWRYFFGPGVDEPILADAGGALNCTGTRFLHPDHQGSVIALADCWGNHQGTNSYDEYGIPGAANQGRFQYTGQAWIPELGMYHYKARLYSPTLGRFLQTDPIGYDDQVNLYAYVGDDPINANDPTGTDAVTDYGPGGSKFTEEERAAYDNVESAFYEYSGAKSVVDFFRKPSFRGATDIVLNVVIGKAKPLKGPAGLIYRRIDKAKPGGKCYIGRCNSVRLFERRQRAHGRASPDADYQYEVIERADPGKKLRQAEQRQIDAHGGPTNKSNPHGGTENKRNEIAPCKASGTGINATVKMC